jgi:hypothetical protein
MNTVLVVLAVIGIWVLLAACVCLSVCMLSSRLTHDGVTPQDSPRRRWASYRPSQRYPVEAGTSASRPIPS